MTLRFRWEGGPEIPHRISGLIISNPDPFSEISAPAPPRHSRQAKVIHELWKWNSDLHLI
jgi:hypothetical protein